MTEPDRYGEEIRRALNAAAELVVPAGDGLDIIRKRAGRRPPVLAWLLAHASYLPQQLVTQVRVMASELAVMARGESDLLPRLRARLRPRAGQAHSAAAWLRPMLAAAGALLLVVAVTFAVPQLRATVTNQASSTRPGGPGGAGRSGQADGSGHLSPGASGSRSGSASGSRTAGVRTPISGRPPGWILFLLGPLPGGIAPIPCVSSTPATPLAGTIAPSASPSPSTTQASAGGTQDPALGGGAAQAGQPECTPVRSSPAPTSSSPTPTTTGTPTPTGTPTSSSPTPTTTPTTSPTPTTNPTPTTSSTPTAGSTNSTPTGLPPAPTGSPSAATDSPSPSGS